ncbi:MAG: 50S ribosomal protein L15 [Gammaproteobacteria bacterium]|nr:50S ribosomal protein L15 [Gammaproteobacteria bacterium]NNF60947.1 50S ribosomal protein L15 [Gammaproteobacteria bacterium]NNM20836.1 50S ribosomal protein L15 [Gammaproteobacteria bacterium]
MRLNTIKPAAGSKQREKRLGRGRSSGHGKTSARGQKGQKARSGGYHKVGFEGGQMPLQRRLPKVGFHSRKARYTGEVRLHEAAIVAAGNDGVVDMDALRSANIISAFAKKAKVILSGEINDAVTVRGVAVTKGARAAIEAAGGKIEG